MSRIVRLTERDLSRLVKRVLSEQKLNEEENIVKGTSWDYLKKDGIYYARKTNTTKWIRTSGEVANAIATKIFKTPIKTDNVKTQIKTNNVKSPFENKGQGDLFRQYVIKYYPNIAKKNDLSIKGAFNNSNIINSSNEIITTKKYGKIKLSDLFFKQNQQAKLTSGETGQTKIKQNNMNVLVSDTLVNKKILFDPKRETTPFKCTEDGCAQWVSNQLDDLGVRRQGNAWHSHNNGQSNLKSTPFMNMGSSTQDQAAKIFSAINSNPIEKGYETGVKSFVKTLIPNQGTLKKTLKVNDIVGLYYDDSKVFTQAFFEGATGVSGMGSGTKSTDGPYFRKKDGKPWTPADLGKKIQFLPGNSLKNGSGFGMNTHLGYVGAIVNGEPIIFHNIHNTVHATPLSKMGETKIFWVKNGPNTKVVNPKETSPSWWKSFTSFF